MMVFMENEVEETIETPVQEQPKTAIEIEQEIEHKVDAVIAASLAPPPEARKPRKKRVPKDPPVADNHCPACKMGQDAAKGEGTHLLLTIEHPYDPGPVAAPEKPAKRVARPMAKELRGASSFAEKTLPRKIAEKARLMGDLARCEAEIQELVRVIQALGGQLPVGMPPLSGAANAPLQFNPNPGFNYPMPEVPNPAQQAQGINPDNLRLGQIPDILRAQGGAVNNSELTGPGWV